MLRLFSKSGKKHTDSIALYQLPLIPPQVTIRDVDHNGMLINPKLAKKIKKNILALANTTQPIRDHQHTSPSTRYQKASIASPYSIIKYNDAYYAIYRGEKWCKHLGSGQYGKTKLIQNIDTGKWYTYKIQAKKDPLMRIEDFINDINTEYHNITALHYNEIPPTERISTKSTLLQYNFAMQYMPGIPLDQLQSRQYNHPVRSTSFWLNIAIRLIKTIDDINTNLRTLHCALKPANIIYDQINNAIHIIGWDQAKTIRHGKIEKRCVERGALIFSDIEQRRGLLDPERENKWKKHEYPSYMYNPLSERYACAIIIAAICHLLDPALNTLFSSIASNNSAAFTPEYNYISQPGKFIFENNTRIRNRETRAELVTLLNAMTAPDIESRPLSQQILDKLEEMQYKTLMSEGSKKIPMLHVNQLVNMHIDERFAFLTELSQQSSLLKIYLLDTKETDNTTLFQLRREFENVKIPVAEDVLRNPKLACLIRQGENVISRIENKHQQPINGKPPKVSIEYIDISKWQEKPAVTTPPPICRIVRRNTSPL